MSALPIKHRGHEMKYLLLVLLLAFSAPLFAQTNVYYNTDSIGEGITVYEYADLLDADGVLFYYFTYGGGKSDQRQRWFTGNGEVTKDGDTVGKLYITHGDFFPFGTSCGAFEYCVGELELAGYYVLRPNPDGAGYQLWVEPPEGDEAEPKIDADESDSLYQTIHTFDTPLLNQVIVK